MADMGSLAQSVSSGLKGANRVDAGKAQTTSLFPSRLLGFGVFTAWSSISIDLEVNLDVASLSSPIGRFFLMSALCVALYLAIAVAVRRTGNSPLGRRSLAVCAVASVAFPLLEVVASATRLFAFDVVALVCLSVATVGLFLMWNAQISSHGPKTALTAYGGSFTLAACVYFLVTALGGVAFALSLVVLPLLSCFLLRMSDRLEKPSHAEPDHDVQWRVPWRPIVLVVLFTWSFGTVAHFNGNALMPSELGRLLAGGCVLLAAVTLFARFDENVVAKVAAILAAGALLVCSVQGPDLDWGVSKLLASVGYYGFMLFVLFTLSLVCYRHHVRAEWLFSIVQAACVAAEAPGGQFGNALLDAWAAGQPAVASATTAALALALLAACLFLLSENPFAGTWGVVSARRTAKGAGENSGQPPMRDYLADLTYRCALIARNYGLTHREEEVLGLLADNKSFADIESTLVIAHGTLRAHVQHLYEKLGVHSKQEAVDFVNDWRG